VATGKRKIVRLFNNNTNRKKKAKERKICSRNALYYQNKVYVWFLFALLKKILKTSISSQILGKIS